MTISNNQFSAEASAVTNNYGVQFISIQDAINPVFTNNTITGTDYGIILWNVPTSNTITLGATNSISNTKKAGIFFTNNLTFNAVGTTPFGSAGGASTLNVNGIGISSAATGTGIIADATGGTSTTLNFGAVTTLNNGAGGLSVIGSTAAITGNTLSNLTFVGQTGSYITLSNNAFTGQQLNATATLFDTKTGATATLAENFAIEDKIVHQIDNSALGFVLVKANQDFVTANSFIAPATTTPSIQRGVNAASTNFTVNVNSGTYNEQVLVNKSLTVLGATPKPVVNFTGTVSGKPSLFDVSQPNVTIDNLEMQVDLVKLSSAIIASAVDLDNLAIKNNDIEATGSSAAANFGAYGNRNAVSINYTGGINYRIAAGGVDNVLFQGNTVAGALAGNPVSGGVARFFRAGVCSDEVGGTFTGNTLQSINQDIQVRLGSNGDINVTNNTLNGGGVDLSEHNSGAGAINVTGNIFNGAFANATVTPRTAVLRLRNNQQNKVTTVSGNIFNDNKWALSLENYRNVNVNTNTFNPLAGSTDFLHIGVNTKSISSNSNTIVQTTVDGSFTKNIFNGSGVVGGTGIGFFNHDSDNASFGTFTIGSAGNENEFKAQIAEFIRLDNQTGSTDPATNPTDYDNGGGYMTTMACWSQNNDIQNNKFDVGAGLQFPSSMNFAQRTALEAALFHKPDAACTGTLFYFNPVHNLTQNTFYPTIQSAVDAAVANDVIECAEWTFNEKVTIDKTLTLQGLSETACIIDGTSLGNGSGITVNTGVTNVWIKYFTIQNHAGTSPNSFAGIYAPGGNSGLKVEHCTIKNNIGGSGLYASGPINGLILDDLDVSGHTAAFGAARGIVVWNGFKENISITNCDVYNNNCCGIELQDGTASGVTMTGNNVHDNSDNGMGLVGLKGGTGANLISGNTVTNNGRFGIEIKNPAGNGLTSGTGSIVVENNAVSLTPSAGMNARDHAGISVYRRGFLVANSAGYPNLPTGVVIQNNNISGYQQLNPGSTDKGYGIVIEGTKHTVTGNTLTNNDVAIQEQGGAHPNSGYVVDNAGDGDQAAGQSPNYFGRGNAPAACGNTISGNNFSGNTTNTNTVTSGSYGLVTNTTTGETFCSIQSAIDDSQTINGHSISVSAATFIENVTINKELNITGAGQTSTFVKPAISNPNCGGAGGGSLCAGGSNVMLVQANNVTIQALQIDGDNPALTSGVVTAGADLDARNGIITNHAAGVYNNLTVNNVTVKNIYLRGMYASSGGSFTFSNNTVDNVQADPGSIAMFNFGGAGSFTNNVVSNSSDAIASNHSTGTTYSGNTVTASGSGIHTDNNGDSGGTGDIIQNNTVSDSKAGGYGIFVFAPYLAAQVKENTITNVDVGLANAGQNAAVTTIFTQNTVDGMNKAGSTGIYQTSSLFGFGDSNVSGLYTNNFVKNNTDGFYLEYHTSRTNAITVNGNSITGNTNGVTLSNLGGTLTNDFECNWWGATSAAGVAAAVGGAVDYTPWRTDGTDSAPGTAGFQPMGPCVATPVVIDAVVADNIVCGESSGSLAVTFSGGTGPYNIAWTGGSATNVTSVYTITGLLAGTYGITVTDANASTATTTAQVLFFPVTNTTNSPNTYYLTIQDAIDASDHY